MDQWKNTFLVEGGIKQQKKKKYTATSFTGHTLCHRLWVQLSSCFASFNPSLNPMKWKSLSRVWLFETPWILQARILEWVAFPFSRGSSQPRSPALQADSLPFEPPGKPKNTGVSLLKRIFLTQWIEEAYPFSSGSSRPRNQTRVSCNGGGFFTNWAMREAQHSYIILYCWCYLEVRKVKEIPAGFCERNLNPVFFSKEQDLT